MRSNAIIALVTMAVFTLLISLLVDQRIHNQADALLLQLVRTEADSAREPHGLHVHDTSLSINTMEGQLAEKFSLIYDTNCQIRDRTRNFRAFTLPQDWCDPENPHATTPALGAQSIIDIDQPHLPRLRAAALTTRTLNGETVTYLVAVDHAAIDAAIWQTLRLALLLAVFVIAALTIAGAAAAASLTRDLTRLGAACNAMGRGHEDLRSFEPDTAFRVSRKAPEELRTLTETLNALVQRLQKTLHSQDRFIAEAAHELRTPLTALMGDLELSLRRERPAHELREALHRALDDARRLHTLAESLLDAARTESTTLDPKPTEILPLLHQSLDRFAPQFKAANIHIDLQLAAPTSKNTTAFIAPLATSRVFDNLLQNTLQHADATRLTIHITPDPNNTSPNNTSNTLHIEFHDNGRGIPDDLAPQLFTPFVHSTEGKGHGLGLYLARLMMRKQGGDLQHIPTPTGTTWRLLFERHP